MSNSQGHLLSQIDLLICIFICMILAAATSMASDPGADDAMNTLQAAEDLQTEGKIQEALSAYEEVLRNYPDTEMKNDILVKMARCYERLGDDGSAIQTYLKLVSENPDTIEASQAVSLMMNLYYQRYQFDEVMAMCSYIVQEFPDTQSAAMALYRGAGYLYTQGEYQKAIDMYESFMEKFPASIMKSTAFNRLISLYIREGTFEKAESKLIEKLEQTPGDKYMLRQLAVVYQKQGNYDRALELYQEILATDPEDLDTYEQLGELYAEKGDSERAIAEWSKITEFTPGQYSRHQMLAYILKSHGFYDQAAEEYRKAIELSPGVHYLYTQLADVYVVRKQFDAAIDVYLDLLAISPPNHPNRSIITATLLELCDLEGLHGKVISKLEGNLARSPDNVPTMLTLADFYFHRGSFEDSLRQFRNIAVLYPDQGAVLFSHAEMLERERQFNHAVAFYQTMLDLFPDSIISPQALFHIGLLRSQLRQSHAAIASLRSLISKIDTGSFRTTGQIQQRAAPQNGEIQLTFSDRASPTPGSFAGSAALWLNAYMLIGDIYLQQMHDVQTALSTYNEAKHKISEGVGGIFPMRPGSVEFASDQLPDLELRIAECYRLMDGYDRAESILDSMQISYKSRDVAVKIAKLRGDCYFSRGDFDSALTQYQEAIQWLKNEDWINDALDRIALIKEHSDRGPKSLLRIHAQVEKLKKTGQYDAALSLCVSVARERGADVSADRIWLEVGDILALQTKALEAVSAYEELIQSRSALAPEAQSRIAGIYWEQLNDPKQAIAAYSILIENYPDSVLVADARKQIRRLATGGMLDDNLP